MIRYIRLLGAALGGLVGLVLATAGEGLFNDASYAGFLLAAWVVAWVVVGFAILPYLTLVPAQWLISRVEDLSTAEFVTAVVQRDYGMIMGTTIFYCILILLANLIVDLLYGVADPRIRLR